MNDISIAFANWIADQGFRKIKVGHPNKIGMWFSDNREEGFLSSEDLFDLFLSENH